MKEENILERYSVYKFNGSTYVVIDQVEQRENCICGNYDEWEDAEERAEKVASLLNASGTESNNFVSIKPSKVAGPSNPYTAPGGVTSTSSVQAPQLTSYHLWYSKSVIIPKV